MLVTRPLSRRVGICILDIIQAGSTADVLGNEDGMVLIGEKGINSTAGLASLFGQ